MLERLIPWERWYPQRVEGMVDIAWTDGAVPAAGGRCPLCGGQPFTVPACCERDREAILAVTVPFLREWYPGMPRRDQQVVDQLLQDLGW